MTSGETAAIQVRLHRMMPVAIAIDLGTLGPRRMVVVSLAACALAPSVGALIAARAVQGNGAALVLRLSLSRLRAAFPPQREGG